MYLNFSLKSLVCMYVCERILHVKQSFQIHTYKTIFLFPKTNGFLPFYMRGSMRISLFKICYEIKIITFTQWNRYYYDITQEICCNIPGLE